MAAALAAVVAALVLRGRRPPLEELQAWGRSRGISIAARSVERGWFDSVLRDVEVKLADGMVMRAAEATFHGGPFAARRLRVPELRVSIRSDPFEAYSRLTRAVVPDGIELDVTRLAIDVQHRAVGALLLDDVSGRRANPESVLRADRLRLGPATFTDVSFALSEKRNALELSLGSGSGPTASATYVPSDGRAAEWTLRLPHQPLPALRRALGLGDPSPEDAARGSGLISWIVPDDPGTAPRGSFRFVVDGWYRPAWPDAAALVGSSGAVAAAVRPSSGGPGFDLERADVIAGLFNLKGSGKLTPGETSTAVLVAEGSRTCGELAVHLGPSRHRDAVRAFLGMSRSPEGPGVRESIPATPAASGRVELAVRIDVAFGRDGHLGFHWHLTPGCGLSEMG